MHTIWLCAWVSTSPPPVCCPSPPGLDEGPPAVAGGCCPTAYAAAPARAVPDCLPDPLRHHCHSTSLKVCWLPYQPARLQLPPPDGVAPVHCCLTLFPPPLSITFCVPSAWPRYIYGGLVGANWGWRAAFLLESAAMVPFAVFCLLAAPIDIRGTHDPSGLDPEGAAAAAAAAAGSAGEEGWGEEAQLAPALGSGHSSGAVGLGSARSSSGHGHGRSGGSRGPLRTWLAGVGGDLRQLWRHPVYVRHGSWRGHGTLCWPCLLPSYIGAPCCLRKGLPAACWLCLCPFRVGCPAPDPSRHLLPSPPLQINLQVQAVAGMTAPDPSRRLLPPLPSPQVLAVAGMTAYTAVLGAFAFYGRCCPSVQPLDPCSPIT